jgi:hypothetical protein
MEGCDYAVFSKVKIGKEQRATGNEVPTKKRRLTGLLDD